MTKKKNLIEIKTIEIRVGETQKVEIPTSGHSHDFVFSDKFGHIVPDKITRVMTVVPRNSSTQNSSLYRANKKLRSGERPIEGDTQEERDLETIRVR